MRKHAINELNVMLMQFEIRQRKLQEERSSLWSQLVQIVQVSQGDPTPVQKQTALRLLRNHQRKQKELQQIERFILDRQSIREELRRFDESAADAKLQQKLNGILRRIKLPNPQRLEEAHDESNIQMQEIRDFGNSVQDAIALSSGGTHPTKEDEELLAQLDQLFKQQLNYRLDVATTAGISPINTEIQSVNEEMKSQPMSLASAAIFGDEIRGPVHGGGFVGGGGGEHGSTPFSETAKLLLGEDMYEIMQ